MLKHSLQDVARRVPLVRILVVLGIVTGALIWLASLRHDQRADIRHGEFSSGVFYPTAEQWATLTIEPVQRQVFRFEREVIGERVRDKIAASKRKGIWVGGPVPLGYASINKKLVVVPEKAETVRLIFRRYLEVGSIRALVQDLDDRGIRTKRQAGSNDQTRGGIRFGVGAPCSPLAQPFLRRRSGLSGQGPQR